MTSWCFLLKPHSPICVGLLIENVGDLNSSYYPLPNFILNNLYSICQRHNATFLLRTQLEFDATVLQRSFTYYSAYRQANEIGIVELDSCSLGTVIIEDFN